MPKRVIIDDASPTPAGNGSTAPIPTASPGSSITQATYDAVDKRRHTCWTINNWTTEDLERVRDYHHNTKSVRYGCWSQEVSTTGTPHIQGYTSWRNSMSLEAFKRKVAPGRLHYEPYTNGTAQENHDYCAGLVEKKGNTLNPTFEEYGEMPNQGDRTDWRKAVNQVRERVPVVDVIADQPHLLPTIRALERLATLTRQPPKDRDVRVLYIHGPAGCGKTRAIHTTHPDAYWKPEGQWWDGYEGQEVVVLDDYYGDMPYAQLLRVLDRYPLRLPVKGGFVPAEYTTVLITSNASLDEQYPGIAVPNRREALYRRIHRVLDGHKGISPEHITDALREEAVHPQVQYPKVPHPSHDPSTDPADASR